MKWRKAKIGSLFWGRSKYKEGNTSAEVSMSTTGRIKVVNVNEVNAAMKAAVPLLYSESSAIFFGMHFIASYL